MRFREIANTLPTTPTVLSWVSERLTPQSSGRANTPPLPASPATPSARIAVSPTSTENHVYALSPSPEVDERILSLKRSRSSSGSLTPPPRAARSSNRTLAPSAIAIRRPRPSAPSPDPQDASGRRCAERFPRASREFLEVLIRGSALGKVKGILCWATKQWPEDPALSYDDLELFWKHIGSPRTRIAARWRKVLLEAALVYEPLEKCVIGEAPTALVMASVPNGDFVDMCNYFATRIMYMEGEKFPRSDESLTRMAANSLGTASVEMIGAMLQALPKLKTFDAKAACLRSTTAIISTVLARCNDTTPMEHTLRSRYAIHWEGHIRTAMGKMTDAELTRMRRTSYPDLLLSVRKSIAVFREREAAERLRQQHELERLRQEQEQQQRQRQVDRDALREAHPDYRPSPSPRPPPPSQPNVYVMWPGFEEKTMVYFADRTGGWDEAWD